MRTVNLKNAQDAGASLRRNQSDELLKSSVSKIISDVRQKGDKALVEYSKKFDSITVKPENLKVDIEEIKAASESVEADFADALTKARKNIEEFHSKQTSSSWLKTEREEMVGQIVGPVEKAGLYVPAGTAGYPSTVLMTAIPAKIAGVSSIFMATPPEKDGKASKYTLAAAYECGIDEIFAIGGAQAIAAMAYGTQTVPKADVIAGPGNAYVTEAKRQVFGDVGIDMVAGPSEVAVIADIRANPEYVAADLVSQAEHDSDATAILITDSAVLAKKVVEKIDYFIKKLPRKDIATKSIKDNGIIFMVKDMDEAFKAVNAIAPEHLVVLVEQPTRWLPFIKNAGAIYLGNEAVQSAGDYGLGPNHVLPTGGSARFSSPLSVNTFRKSTNLVWLGKKPLQENAEAAITLATAEGFEAHANAIRERL